MAQKPTKEQMARIVEQETGVRAYFNTEHVSVDAADVNWEVRMVFAENGFVATGQKRDSRIFERY